MDEGKIKHLTSRVDRLIWQVLLLEVVAVILIAREIGLL